MARNKEQALDELIIVRNKVKDAKEMVAASLIDLNSIQARHKSNQDNLSAAEKDYKEAEKSYRATPNG